MGPFDEGGFGVVPPGGEGPVEERHLELHLQLVAEPGQRPGSQGGRRHGPGSPQVAGERAGLEHAGGAVDQQADRVGAAGGEVAPLEHPLVEAGSQEEGGVRRQVAGVVAGAQAAALVGGEERVQLAGDVALPHGPGPGGGLERLPARQGEAAEAIGERGHDQPPGLAGGQVHLRSLADPEDLVGGRVGALLGPVGTALEGLDGGGGAAGSARRPPGLSGPG